jgi:hypothetical protein
VTDVAEEFLVGLSERGYESLLAKTSGRLAIELMEGTTATRWVVTLDQGKVTLARGVGRPTPRYGSIDRCSSEWSKARPTRQRQCCVVRSSSTGAWTG